MGKYDGYKDLGADNWDRTKAVIVGLSSFGQADAYIRHDVRCPDGSVKKLYVNFRTDQTVGDAIRNGQWEPEDQESDQGSSSTSSIPPSTSAPSSTSDVTDDEEDDEDDYISDGCEEEDDENDDDEDEGESSSDKPEGWGTFLLILGGIAGVYLLNKYLSSDTSVGASRYTNIQTPRALNPAPISSDAQPTKGSSIRKVSLDPLCNWCGRSGCKCRDFLGFCSCIEFCPACEENKWCDASGCVCEEGCCIADSRVWESCACSETCPACSDNKWCDGVGCACLECCDKNYADAVRA